MRGPSAFGCIFCESLSRHSAETPLTTRSSNSKRFWRNPAGRRAEIVHHVDVMPTLLDLLGFETPADTSGIALGPVLRGDSSLPDRLVYCDEDFDLSAYSPGGFVRVDGILAA